MRQVAANIQSSIAGRDQEMLVIYNNPTCHELLVSDGLFCKHREYLNDWGKDIFVYSTRTLQHSRLNHSLS